MLDDFISFAEAAKYLDLDVATLTQLVKVSGLILFRIEHGRRQISRAELEILEKRCRTQPGALLNIEPATRQNSRNRKILPEAPG